MADILYGLFQSLVRLVSASAVTMVLLGVLHGMIPPVPALGFWAVTVILVILGILVKFVTYEAREAIASKEGG